MASRPCRDRLRPRPATSRCSACVWGRDGAHCYFGASVLIIPAITYIREWHRASAVTFGTDMHMWVPGAPYTVLHGACQSLSSDSACEVYRRYWLTAGLEFHHRYPLATSCACGRAARPSTVSVKVGVIRSHARIEDRSLEKGYLFQSSQLTPFPPRGFLSRGLGPVHTRGGHRNPPRDRPGPFFGSPGPTERGVGGHQRKLLPKLCEVK